MIRTLPAGHKFCHVCGQARPDAVMRAKGCCRTCADIYRQGQFGSLSWRETAMRSVELAELTARSSRGSLYRW